jgi:hypothetical protein
MNPEPGGTHIVLILPRMGDELVLQACWIG